MHLNRPLSVPAIVSAHAIVLALALSSALALAPASSRADDWPQWMGPTRDGEYRETGLIDQFPASGPRVLWRTPIGGGYAGPAVADSRVYVLDYQLLAGDPINSPETRATVQGRERVHCLDQATGQTLWQFAYDCPYSISYPAGPRCTPTVDGDRVYTLGAQGDLHCLDAATGAVRWSTNFVRDLSAEVPLWGYASHPLVEGELVISMVGGQDQTVVAWDKRTGSVRWRARTSTGIGYGSPAIIEAGGKRQLVIWHADALESLNPEDGSLYWSVPMKPDYGLTVMRPQRWKDRLFASALGNQAVMLRLHADAPGVDELWFGEPKTAVYCSNSTPIFYDGTIYGADGQVGHLAAVNAEDGERLWTTFEPTRRGETRRISHGTAFLTHLAGTDRYLIFSELGDLILARLTPEGYTEISRAHVIEPTGEAFGREVVWSHPAYANRTAFIRNDQEIIAVSLAAETPEGATP